MSIKKEIIELITRKKTILYSQKKAEKELLALLQKITDDEKKSLKPEILKLLRKYNKESFSVDGAHDKYKLACTAGFTMLNYSEYKSYWSIDYDKILDWYCPPWFSEYYNNDQWICLGYDKLLEYIGKGYVTPAGSKIAQELVELKSDYKNFQNITLSEHIWTLFQYESEVHLTHRYPKFEKLEWKSKLLELDKEKQIDRSKLLSECLNTSTRNFNKIVVGFFFDLFAELEPTDNELLFLQNEFLTVLQSQHSKPINQTLKYMKRIHKELSFDVEGFMEQVPLLLSWSVKAVVNATLGLIDVLIKAYPTHKEALGILATLALAQEDESLQTKTIKLLAKYKLLEMPSILDEIAIYTEGLYHSTKQLLPELEEVSTGEETIEITPPQHIREDNRIVYPESFDEMVFFFSGVFEQKNIYDFDLFVALLPKLKKLVTEDNIDKLEPAFQRALKCYAGMHNEVSNPSKIVALMAVVFLEFAMFLRETFPSSLATTEKNYNELMKFFSTYGLRTSWSAIMELEEAIGYPTEVTNYALDNNKITTKIQKRKAFGYIESTQAQLLLEMINSKFTFIPLSTPTHTPCWIELSTLLSRIENVEKNTNNIHLLDIQIALSRVLDTSNHIDITNTEFTNIFSYLFNNTPLDMKQVIHPEYWLIAILRRGKDIDAQQFTEEFNTDKTTHNILSLPKWRAYREPWEYEDWEKGVKVKKSVMSPKLTIERKRIVENLPFESIFKHSSITGYEISSYDICNYLYLTPTIPRFLLQNIIIHTAKNYSDTYTTKTLEGISLALIDIWDNFGEIEYLFLAYILTQENKTTRQLASELWHKATLEGTMNHQLLGETLGKLEHNEYAPLKRFTDLIVSNMLNLSTLHNQGLHTLLSSMIANMNDEPIKGTKKLLEIYLEVLSLSKLSVPSETMQKFEVWSEVKSLKSVVKKIKG